PYKRFDLVIQAFNRLGLPLKIFGDGPVLDDLQAAAKPNISFVGRVPDRELPNLYQRAIAYLNPQEEDFGITMVEALATGRPWIAFAAGGALEIVQPGVNGVLFKEQEWESLADTVIRFRPNQFSAATIRGSAERFSRAAFEQRFKHFVEHAWQA